MPPSSKRSRSKGFTLIELVIVIAVLGILAAIAIASFPKIASQAQKSADLSDVASLNKATFTYALQQNLDIGFLFNGAMTDQERMQMLVDAGYLTVTIEPKVPGATIFWDPDDKMWQYSEAEP